MCKKFTADELNIMDHGSKDAVIFQMQDRLDKLEHDYENLIEQIRLANHQRFGRHTEKLEQIAVQLSIFNETEGLFDENNPEPTIEEVVSETCKPSRRSKKKGQREEDLRDLPQEEIPHDVSVKKLNELFGEGNYKSMPDEICWKLRFEPAKWIAEKHVIKVYVGTDELHQDEFLRGDHPDTLFRGSIATPSLVSGIINSKYVNSSPLDRTAREFQVNGLNLSKQTMSNWVIWSAERYLGQVYDMMKTEQLCFHVNQCDETPVEVIHDGRPAGNSSFMWIHITGELSQGPRIITYEYQKTRHSDHPKEYYKDFNGVLMTDGLEQYHKLAREVEGITNANCLAHARRHFTNAIKAMGKGNADAVKSSIAYKALTRIGTIYKLEGALKDMTSEERLKERQSSIKPLMEEYFTWIKETFRQGIVMPKSETGKGIAYSINQEEYLKIFLTDGEVPIDNSACERALRNFTIGRKNWVIINTIRGAEASAVIYSITETARANGLNVYYYMKYLLEQIISLADENGNVEQSKLKPLMPWTRTLPEDCYSKRRN